MRNHWSLLVCLLLGGSSLTLRAATFQVQIRDFFFTPTNLNIAVGDTVLWTNTSNVMTHDTTSTNAAFLWASGDLVAHATYSLTFTNAGTFNYLCSRHFFAAFGAHREQTGRVFVASANLPPGIQLTNPPNNARFRALTNLVLKASATDADGSVTNVQFFTNEIFCGSLAASPYNFTLSNLPAGNYALKARAVDNLGLAATSAVVNVSVLTNAVLTTPERLPAGTFRFSIQGIAGQTYAVEASTNLVNWAAFATNVAPANVFNITDATATNVLRRFYRARQDL